MAVISEKIDELVGKILEKNPRKIFLQLPEGLVLRGEEISKKLDEKGVETYVSLDPCYGACDLRSKEAKGLGCDLIVHVGHSDMGVKTGLPVLYFPFYMEADFSGMDVKEIKGKKIGLITTVNFLPGLDKARNLLEKRDKEVRMESGRKTSRGQILGCDVSAALNLEESVDAYLFIGSGKFHYMGLAIRTDKPIYCYDVDREVLEKASADKFVKEKYNTIFRAKSSKRFGILTSSKPGQGFYNPFKIKSKLEKHGKEAYIFIMDRITPEKLLGLRVDCYVNCACPRIAVENRSQFEKPIINPDELEEVLG